MTAIIALWLSQVPHVQVPRLYTLCALFALVCPLNTHSIIRLLHAILYSFTSSHP